ncbi:MAG: 2-amino-4-hydroxy-6-hydroxymethyldihydropteridine diphosphokinase [Candidatus Omnitrophica bacterium]|nr:2-amino-4-hydroxy-6-hydroxymethyldihydropteridine diphosphokinase [Candidatus Omnitrophota bacterium]MCM8828406.1 2-amino-4-hydroxy-6-hydroxymethyldihydropteridine diphosphokinase [Candidatus Omnitrophota bacterium]
MVEVIISFGSNLGNRRENINKAIKKISEKVEILKVSEIYRSAPQEGVSGGWFLNGVLSGKTSMKPESLLKFLRSIEIELGRPADHKKNTARTIDLDILFYGGSIIRKRNLSIPHPELTKRKFVLKGLMQVSPNFIHPQNKISIKRIWEEFKNESARQKK